MRVLFGADVWVGGCFGFWIDEVSYLGLLLVGMVGEFGLSSA